MTDCSKDTQNYCNLSQNALRSTRRSTRSNSASLPVATNDPGSSTVDGMATRKVTLSIDQTAWTLAEAMAARAGISTSAWLSAAARREAVRLGAGTDWGDTEAEAMNYDIDFAAAEADLRAAG